MVNLIRTFLFSSLVLTALSKNGGNSQNTEKECIDNLEKLRQSANDLNTSINSKKDLDTIKTKLATYLFMLPGAVMKCSSVIEYDVMAEVSGYEPNLTNVKDCKTGYIEFLDQMKRIAKAYKNNSVEQLRLATGGLGPLSDKIDQVCVNPYR